MPPGPNYAVLDAIGSADQSGISVRHESFEARFRQLRFLEGADPSAFGAYASRLQTCGWDYGCLRSTPDWFDRYVAPGTNIRAQPSSYGPAPETAMRVVLDGATSIVHACEADTMVRAAHPVPAPLATGIESLPRSFGCFAAGTEIATERGPVPIESLDTGNLVHTVCDGRLKPVAWTGHRTIDCQRHPRPSRVWPIRISASAFGPNLPQRDLLLSPDHAVYWIDALIPIRCLVNDRTITQTPVTEVTYFHLELAQHDVVLADGLPAETYLDTGPEAAFHGHGSSISLYPDLASRLWDAKACAPLLVTGPVIESLRQWLAIAASRQQTSVTVKTNPPARRAANAT
jgi:hypothetical protein